MAIADFLKLSPEEKAARLKAASGTSTATPATPAYGSNVANFNAGDDTQKKIADLGQQWAAASGNKDLQNQLHEQANALRGGNGSYNAGTGVHTLGQPVQQVAGPVMGQAASIGQGTSGSLIDQLNDAKRNKILADLGKSRDNALSNLSGEKSAIAPKYYDQRNQVAAGAQQKARNFAEYMASRGGASSGANAQATLMQNMSTQGNLGSLGRQEAADFSDIERRTTGVNNAFESDLASANAGIEGDRMQAQLDDYYQEQQRQLQIAGLTGVFNNQKTLEGKQYDSNQTQQQWDNRFNFGQATGTFGNGQQTLQNQQFQYSKDIDGRDYEYQVGRDAVTDGQWAQQFNEEIKQNGIANALNSAREGRISSGGGSSGGSSAKPASITQLLAIWKASGQAPEGIPGVTAGDKLYDEVAARKAAEKKGGSGAWDAIKGILGTVQASAKNNSALSDDELLQYTQ